MVADIASYQGALTGEQLLAAGYGAVNVKVSHGLGSKSVHPQARAWLADTRFQLSTFHWLTADAAGEAQAVHAYTCLQELGVLEGGRPFAHVVDVEAAGVTWEQVRGYCTAMWQLLGRPVALYTGDWYWVPRGWAAGAEYAPWLWAVPNNGSLPAYPGDDSDHWLAGYGGWRELAAMQFNVLPVGGIRVSTSVVRHTAVWSAMRGVPMATCAPCLNTLLAELNAVAPNRDKASDGWIADDLHDSASDHQQDDRGIVHARDFDKDLARAGLSMERVAYYLVNEARAGRLPWVKYIIFDRRIWSASTGFVEREYVGSNPHDKHMHVSAKSGAAYENDTGPIGLASLIEEPDVDLNDKIENDRYPNRTLKQLLNDVSGVRDTLVGDPKAPAPGGPLRLLIEMATDYQRLRTQVNKLAGDMAGERAEVPPSTEAIAQAVVAAITEMPDVTVNVTPEALETAIVNAVHRVSAPPSA
jgi:hypothetical protein